ncbi:MAG: cytochrome c oxidase subunit II [Mycobacteriales bacterium]
MRTPSTSARRLALAACATALLTSGCSGREAYEKAFSLGWPHPVTEQAKSMYETWLGSVAAAAVVGLLMYLLMAWTVIRDRKRTEELPRQVRYNLPIEVLYTVVPFVIIAVLFFYTAVSENKVNKLSKNPDVTIGVVGFQWNWQFNYVDDKVQVTGEPAAGRQAVLVIPVDKRIRFVETSPDVIHSFWVPDFLFKRDVIPGRLNAFEIKPTKIGDYVGRCAELCGEKHDRMNFEVRVVSQQDYDAYIAKLKADPNAAPNALSAAIPTGSN